MESTRTPEIDMSVWLGAPKERTAAYFPTYAALSVAIQKTLRMWVREWLYANLTILSHSKSKSTESLLLYISTTPFAGEPTNIFTYDPSASMTAAAFASARWHLRPELQRIAEMQPELEVTCKYIYGPHAAILASVQRSSGAFLRILTVETAIVEDFVKFAVSDLRSLGPETATIILRRSLSTELKRLSQKFSFGERTDELLELATVELKRLSSLSNE